MNNSALVAKLYALAAVTLLVVVACDKIPLTSPTGSTISLSIDKSVLPLNGQATVRAVVTESSGTPVHNGTRVTFQPSIGRTDPPEAETVNGIATVMFLAGSVSGTGFIHAFSGPARTGSGNASSGGVEVRIGAAAAGGMSVSATPPSVSQSGGTVTISARVMDASNNPLPGVSVLFSASTGTLGSNTALSDADGIARTTLTTTQTTTVTAVAGSAKGDVTVTVSSAPTVAIGAPDTATAGIPVPITITPQGGGGNTSPRQLQTVVVAFGDGQSQTLTNITGAFGLTHTYNSAGGFTISATATDVNGNTGITSRPIVVAHAALPKVTLSVPVNPVPVGSNGVATITVTAEPSSTTGPPIRSVVVRKSDGTVIFSGTATATFTYQFPSGSGQNQITATVTDAAGNTATTSTVVIVG